MGAKVGAPCTDDDYESIVESTTRLLTETPSDRVARFVLVVDPNQPAPNAVWRQRLAEARVTSKSLRYAIVSPSIHERGTVTAIHWLRPPGPGQKVVTSATFSEAVAWLEAESGSLPILHTLYARVREQAARSGAREARPLEAAGGGLRRGGGAA